MLEPNTTLDGRYKVLKEIENGGTEKLYLAIQERSNRKVALKVRKSSKDNLPDRLDREAMLLYPLSHSALPKVIDNITVSEHHCLVLDYIPGENLKRRLDAQNNPFPVEQVLDWADQLLNVLDYLHHQNVIHRNIKLKSIIISEKDKIILKDLMSARDSDELATDDAPLEQISGKGMDAQSDLYSLGVSLYLLMTNVKPVKAVDRQNATAIGQRDPLIPANEQNAGVPAAVAAVLTKAMELDRKNRFASAAEMRRALSDARKGQPVITPPRPPVITIPPPPLPASAIVKRPKKWRWVIAVVSLPLMVAAVLIYAYKIADNKPRNVYIPGPHPGSKPLNPVMNSFEFDIVRLNASGVVNDRRKGQSKYFVQDLGGGLFLEMVEVPGGTFMMGAPSNEPGKGDDELPQHQVTVPTFFMAKYEVNQAQWAAVARLPKVKTDLVTDPSKFKGDDRPVEYISFEEASEFCERLSRLTGRSYQLPSEACWEYACRAGMTTAYNLGETISPEFVNYDGNYPYGAGPKGVFRNQTVGVGSLGAPNAFGLYDMHGNVWELCMDVWHDNYTGAPTDGTVWDIGGNKNGRVVRGGSWFTDGSDCRSVVRIGVTTDAKDHALGFRVIIPATRAD